MKEKGCDFSKRLVKSLIRTGPCSMLGKLISARREPS